MSPLIAVGCSTKYWESLGRKREITAGGGWRRLSATIIGRNSSGSELTARSIGETDLMLAYTRKFSQLPRDRFSCPRITPITANENKENDDPGAPAGGAVLYQSPEAFGL